ncbi:MAG: hypothetical protein P1U34_11780 [Coxiellaceae bacterium]|nr:hypothetical protein [Coxiellaceae bacterium]
MRLITNPVTRAQIYTKPQLLNVLIPYVVANGAIALQFSRTLSQEITGFAISGVEGKTRAIDNFIADIAIFNPLCMILFSKNDSREQINKSRYNEIVDNFFKALNSQFEDAGGHTRLMELCYAGDNTVIDTLLKFCDYPYFCQVFSKSLMKESKNYSTAFGFLGVKHIDTFCKIITMAESNDVFFEMLNDGLNPEFIKRGRAYLLSPGFDTDGQPNKAIIAMFKLASNRPDYADKLITALNTLTPYKATASMTVLGLLADQASQTFDYLVDVAINGNSFAIRLLMEGLWIEKDEFRPAADWENAGTYMDSLANTAPKTFLKLICMAVTHSVMKDRLLKEMKRNVDEEGTPLDIVLQSMIKFRREGNDELTDVIPIVRKLIAAENDDDRMLNLSELSGQLHRKDEATSAPSLASAGLFASSPRCSAASLTLPDEDRTKHERVP